MDTEKIVLYISLGIICLCLITALIVKIVKLFKMPKEERTKLLKTYLKGAIAWAEQEFAGSGRGVTTGGTAKLSDGTSVTITVTGA